jgi:hypothetical protein
MPVRGRGGPQDCEITHYLDTRFTDGGKVEPYAQAALYYPETLFSCSGFLFCLTEKSEGAPWPSAARRIR